MPSSGIAGDNSMPSVSVQRLRYFWPAQVHSTMPVFTMPAWSMSCEVPVMMSNPVFFTRVAPGEIWSMV